MQQSHGWIEKGVHVGMQVMFVFIFLTVFYYGYVVGVEQEEFVRQIDYIVDDLAGESKSGIDKMLKQSSSNRYAAFGVVDGMMDALEEKAIDTTRSANKSIEKQNQTVKTKSMDLIAIICPAIFTVIVLLTVLGFSTNLWGNTKQALLAVIFVAFTEYSFLMLVTSQYIAADPYFVKRAAGAKIQQWIENARASGKIKPS